MQQARQHDKGSHTMTGLPLDAELLRIWRLVSFAPASPALSA